MLSSLTRLYATGFPIPALTSGGPVVAVSRFAVRVRPRAVEMPADDDYPDYVGTSGLER